jgi:hypothetical protein
LAEGLTTCLEISSTRERVKFVITWAANTPFDNRFDDDDDNDDDNNNNNNMDCK